jgi:HK97 family phage portal protein
MNELYNLLNVQPNNLQGAFMFKKNMVLSLHLRGEAFIRIWRTRNNRIVKLKLLNPNLMKVEVDEELDEMRYIYHGEWVDASDIIHVINYPDDKGRGRSTISYAADTLGMGIEIEKHQRSIFQKAGKIFGMLKPKDANTIVKDTTKIKNKFVQNISDDTGIIVLDHDFEFTPLTLTPKDAQIIESKNVNVNDICRFFGVPSILVYDTSVSSNYNSSEQVILEFINNGLHPLMEKIENEFFRKLFLPSEWNLKDLLFNGDDLYRLDYKAMGEYFTKLQGVGAITPNEIRAKIRSKPVTGGNRAFVNTNVQPLDNLIYDQKKKPIDNNAK